MMSIEPHTEGNDMKKCGDLSWLERMSKEIENDPEYLREYIELCSGEIDCQKEKITALEKRIEKAKRILTMGHNQRERDAFAALTEQEEK